MNGCSYLFPEAQLIMRNVNNLFTHFVNSSKQLAIFECSNPASICSDKQCLFLVNLNVNSHGLFSSSGLNEFSCALLDMYNLKLESIHKTFQHSIFSFKITFSDN